MRSFFSPAERGLLAALPEGERELVEGLMRDLDARLVEDVPEPEQEPLQLFESEAA